MTRLTPFRVLATAALGCALAGGCATALAETVLITGANSGIGLELASQYAAKGWTVIATQRRAEVPKSLADLMAKYPKVSVEALDVTNAEQAAALAKKLSDTPIDVLINNAGVYNDRGNCKADDEACPGTGTPSRSVICVTLCSIRFWPST